VGPAGDVLQAGCRLWAHKGGGCKICWTHMGRSPEMWLHLVSVYLITLGALKVCGCVENAHARESQ
jgi:hypothetical protein